MATLNRDKYPVAKGRRRRTAPQTIRTAELAARCMALRKEGLTNSAIAARLSADGSANLDEGRVSALITGYLRDLTMPLAEDLKLAQAEKIDRIMNRAWVIASSSAKDRVPALAQALNALAAERALWGLDAPKQTEIKDTTPDGPAPATSQDIVAQLAEEARLDLAKQGLEYDPVTGAIRPIE